MMLARGKHCRSKTVRSPLYRPVWFTDQRGCAAGIRADSGWSADFSEQ
ncbi:hypothetical protein [Roseibium hamelinense]|nr:hypothetical protein [Roseibium hamelinense]